MTSQSNERDQARERNRADFPTLAAIMDELRRVFGEGVRLEYGEEGALDGQVREIGAAPRYTAVVTLPDTTRQTTPP